MLDLKIETKSKKKIGSIKYAYNMALEQPNYGLFLSSLYRLLPVGIETGTGGNHIWIADRKTGKRLAIIIIN